MAATGKSAHRRRWVAALALLALCLVAALFALPTTTSGDASSVASQRVHPAPSARTKTPAAQAPPLEPACGVCVVFGEVYRGASEPAVGALVSLAEPGNQPRVVHADERGRYCFERLPDGCRGMVRASFEGLAPASVQLMPLAQNEVRRLDPLVLTALLRVTCRVLTIGDEPIAGATVEAYSHSARGFFGAFDSRLESRDVPVPAATRTTGADGLARFDSLGAADWTFVARKPGFVDAATECRNLRETVERPVELHMAPGVRFEGRVLDGAARPLTAIVVWAEGTTSGWIDPNGSPAARPRAVSGADGRFAFDALPAGEMKLWVSRLGATRVEYGTVRLPYHGECVLVLDGARIEGTVIDGDSRAPVPGAVVSGVTSGRHSRGTRSFSVVRTVADASGGYVIDTMIGAERLSSVSVDAAGRMLDPSDPAALSWPGLVLEPGSTTHHDLVLRRTARIVGRVTCDGSPVAGIEVQGSEDPYARNDTARQRRNVRTFTDADGRYALDGFPPGWMCVGIHDPDFAHTALPAGWSFWPPERQHTLPVYVEVRGPGDIVHDVEVVAVVQKAATIGSDVPAEPIHVRGVVVGPDGPIAGALVKVKAHDETYGWWDPESETCWRSVRPVAVGVNGRFDVAFESVRQKRCWIRASAPGYATSSPVLVEDLDGVETTIRLERAATIRGRVMFADGGLPVVGANVGLDEPWRYGERWSNRVVASVASVTDADGRFEIDGIAEGEHEVLVVADGCLFATLRVQAPTQTEPTIELTRAMTIEGEVVCEDGTPAANFSVAATPECLDVPLGGGTTASQSGVDGRFRLLPIARGTYTIAARGSLPGRSLSRETLVRGVAGGSVGVRVVVASAPTLSGRVVDPEGCPVARAAVSAWRISPPIARETTSAADGSFELVGLSEGDLRLVVVPPGVWPPDGAVCVLERQLLRAELVTSAGGPDVVVSLARGLAIEGVARSADGRPLRGAIVIAAATTKSRSDPCGGLVAADGSFTITGLAPGTYKLGVSDVQRPSRTLPLVGGESVEAGARDVDLRATR
jgi:hypothetical protein